MSSDPLTSRKSRCLMLPAATAPITHIQLRSFLEQSELHFWHGPELHKDLSNLFLSAVSKIWS